MKNSFSLAKASSPKAAAETETLFACWTKKKRPCYVTMDAAEALEVIAIF